MHEVPGVVAALCECMGGYRDVYIRHKSPVVHHFCAKLDLTEYHFKVQIYRGITIRGQSTELTNVG